MSVSEIVLHGFAYGEDLDAFGQRSLGYHLIAPAGGTKWCREVEMLARRLQAAPYPDSWPAVDLFCSVLLADHERLIAVARYGLTDHSRDERRGGLELIGVVTPETLSIPVILSIYHWLQSRRAAANDLHALGGHVRLAETMTSKAIHCRRTSARPQPPDRLWNEGAILFGAASANDPDEHLDLIDLARSAAWQWLPLIGADFSLQEYARRGPLVAWTARPAETDRAGDPRPRPLDVAAIIVYEEPRPPA
jgi:hypothetical protein